MIVSAIFRTPAPVASEVIEAIVGAILSMLNAPVIVADAVTLLPPLSVKVSSAAKAASSSPVIITYAPGAAVADKPYAERSTVHESPSAAPGVPAA